MRKVASFRRTMCIVLVGCLAPIAGVGLADTASSAIVTVALVSPASVTALPNENIHVQFAATTLEGAAAPAGESVRVELIAGSARFDADRTDADAITDDRGHIDVVVHPHALPETVQFAVTGGSAGASIALRITEPPARFDAPPAIVVGVATAGAGPVPGSIESADGARNGTLARRGSVSIFASGAVARETNVTVAYATADTLDQTPGRGAFIDDPNDRPFPVYGDASVRFDEALSRSHLYARIDRAGSAAMWGEFTARGGSPDANGGYAILVNGAQARVKAGVVRAGAFTSRSDVAYGRTVLSPTGLGVVTQTLQPNIVVASDVLTLVSVDPRSGAIITQRVLARGIDYVLDDATGMLRFIDIILPYDGAGDPQNVIVQYQYSGAGVQSSIAGANASLRLGGNRGRADVWYLNAAAGAGNLSLAGESVGGATAATTWSAGHERSTGDAPATAGLPAYGSTGDTYHARFQTHAGLLNATAAFDSASAGYQNPYGTVTTPGLSSARVAVTQRISSIAAIEASYLASKNLLPATPAVPEIDNSDVRAALTFRVQPSRRLRYHAGAVAASSTGNGVVSGASQTAVAPIANGDPIAIATLPGYATYAQGSGSAVFVDAGFAWELLRGVTLDAERLAQLSKTSDPFQPATTQIGITIATGGGNRAFVRQRWQSASVSALAATQQNATYAGTARSTTTAGFAQRVGETTIETGYAVDQTANGRDLYEAIGARRSFRIGRALSGDAFVQSGQSLTPQAAGSDPHFVAFGTSLSYAEHDLSVAGQVQVRTGYNGGSSFLAGASGPLGGGFSIFGNTSGAYTSTASSTHTRGGLAFRPAENDRSITLFSIDAQTGNLFSTDGYSTNIAQLQELYRPGRRIELATSVAYKITGDATFAPRTLIFGVRADQRIGARLDLAAELHRSATAPIDGTAATGVAVEAGVRLGGAMRLALGYNVSGFANPAAAVAPAHRGLYATMSSYVDRIFGWGRAR